MALAPMRAMTLLPSPLVPLHLPHGSSGPSDPVPSGPAPALATPADSEAHVLSACTGPAVAEFALVSNANGSSSTSVARAVARSLTVAVAVAALCMRW